MTAPRSGGRKWSRWLVWGYLIALVISGLTRRFQDPTAPHSYQTTQSLLPVEGDLHVEGPEVRMAYADSGGDGIPVLLLHGSPVASSSLMDVHRALSARGYRVLTPDLPGFGRSSRDVPDYSVRAHARYVLSWLDSLAVSSAHFVAYSMSGGVALEAYRLEPERIRSVVMLSAIGVQELELTGDYYLNHAIHGLQLGSLWLVREAIPHFGFLDDAVLGVPYGRNFYETDQRPLRALLLTFAPPMRIVHGVSDQLVPYAAAVEHQRLVPQSELISMASQGHGLPFTAPDTTAALIHDFVAGVARGEIAGRASALPERVAAAARPFDPTSLPPPGRFAATILILLVALATMVSEDLASIGAGLMAARGTLTFPQAVMAALGGIVLGDISLYLAGRWIGRPLVHRAPFRWFISEDRLATGERWFREKGVQAVISARFLPGTRLPTYVAAGILKAPFFKFFGYFLIAALLWTPAIVGASMVLGQQVLGFYETFERFALWGVLGLVVVLLLVFRLGPLVATHQGRRRLVASWRRVTRWEFWPPWLFYPPVVAYCVWLGIRFRNLLAFASANPGIPYSGFIGESKASILNMLPSEWVAEFMKIEGVTPQKGLTLVHSFMGSRGLEYPVVLKPDVGERGRGVVLAHSDSDILSYFGATEVATIIQRFIPGPEFGVFFYRNPDTGQGKIFSITDKYFPTVSGDGHRTLQELILDDDRAVTMHRTYARINRSRLFSVPEEGDVVELAHIGTHSRGAVFLDGTQLINPELETAFLRIADSFDGFHFGRFDVRASSRETFLAGTDFKVIELNGVTSEATHIYHPGSSLLSAYRVLFAQWELAYRIGLNNIKAGAPRARFIPMIRALAQHARAIRIQTSGGSANSKSPDLD